jgi:hypothetical protein
MQQEIVDLSRFDSPPLRFSRRRKQRSPLSGEIDWARAGLESGKARYRIVLDADF